MEIRVFKLIVLLVLSLNVSFSFSQTGPCGLIGSVAERIKNCSAQSFSNKKTFILVSRTNDMKEVYKQTSNSLIWSDRLPVAVPFLDALDACHGSLKEVAGLTQLKWRLPTLKEFQLADKEGMRWSLSNVSFWYWSSTGHEELYNYVWLYSGYDGYIDFGNRNYDYVKFSVRCVAK